MKKLLFTLATLLLAGTAYADRVVTFDGSTESASWIETQVGDMGDVMEVYQLSKDGVTITLKATGYNEVNQEGYYYVGSGTGVVVESELYSVDDDAPSYERYHGGISHIEFVCANGGLTNPDNLYQELPNSYDDVFYTIGDRAIYHCYSEEGHCPQFVQFGNYGHVLIYKISVTLYGVDPVTPDPGPDPQERTGSPVFNGYTTDGIHAYFVEILETEPSTIYYRCFKWDDAANDWVVYGAADWTEYTGILSFTEDGKYRVEAYAQADGKAASYDIAYEFVVSPKTGLSEMNEGKTVTSTRYFNMAGQEMQDVNGMTIVVTTYTDGTTSAVKVMR